jgi:preprotein translocase subunit SecD
MTPSRIVIAYALVAQIAIASSQLTAQDPTSPSHITRLVYELPIDSLQRTLRRDTNNTMESLLKQAIDAITKRVSTAHVTRVDAASFSVDLATESNKDISIARARIEAIGSLEMRILARHDYAGTELGLTQERKRLEAWLGTGGRAKLRANLNAISQHRVTDPSKIRWVPRKILADRGKWGYSLSHFPTTSDATVRAFTDEQWNKQRIPPAMLNDEKAFLIELIAVNMHEACFTQQDLRRDRVSLVTSQNGIPYVNYEITKPRCPDYEAWTEKHIGHATAIIVDGELLSAPTFVGKVASRGTIRSNFDQVKVENLVSVLQSGALPAKPYLVKQERLPADKSSAAKQPNATNGK